MAYTDNKKYKVTDAQGKSWVENLSEKEVALYESWGWTVEPA